jgi:aminoglycoside phosphotransferase family enzyme
MVPAPGFIAPYRARAPGGEGESVNAALLETHAAILFFVGDRAYKLKKPVDLGFLDFRSRADRERVCRREVALNRRLAPDVYLGVADVVGPDGTPCDHLVVMRRMPAERRLSTLVRSGAPVEQHLRRLARMLAAFHSAPPAGGRRSPQKAPGTPCSAGGTPASTSSARSTGASSAPERRLRSRR